MKILILGGDGFCGWPTTLHLSNLGHEILIVDSFARREIESELGAYSLTPILSLNDRLNSWHKISGFKINYKNFDLSKNFDLLLDLLKYEKPEAIIHFAEQRAAPYSMKTASHKIYTVNNNISCTNIL